MLEWSFTVTVKESWHKWALSASNVDAGPNKLKVSKSNRMEQTSEKRKWDIFRYMGAEASAAVEIIKKHLKTSQLISPKMWHYCL